MRLVIACAAVSLVCACSPPSPQPQPNEMETVNATRVDQAAPEGALENTAGNYGDGGVARAEPDGAADSGNDASESPGQ